MDAAECIHKHRIAIVDPVVLFTSGAHGQGWVSVNVHVCLARNKSIIFACIWRKRAVPGYLCVVALHVYLCMDTLRVNLCVDVLHVYLCVDVLRVNLRVHVLHVSLCVDILHVTLATMVLDFA